MIKIRLRIQRPWIPYIILIITLALTIISTIYVYGATYNEDNLRFINAVQDTENSIYSRLTSYITLLRGAAGLYAANPDMTPQQFNAFVNRLHLSQNYPGSQGIGFVQKVTANDKKKFIQTVRSQGNPTFNIYPPGNRSEYYVVRYLTVSDKEIPDTIGNDMAVNPIMRRAMNKARDLGTTAISKKLYLWTRNHIRKTGFILFTPVYQGGTIPSTVGQRRNKIAGFIYSAFNADDLLTGILNTKSYPQLLNYQIYDGKQITKKNLLEDSRVLTHYHSGGYLPRFQTTQTATIGDEIWTIHYSNHPQFDIQSQKNLPFFIFAGGFVVSIMLFLLSRSQYIAKNKAEFVATQLKDSQKELQKAIGVRDNFISIASHELKTPVTSLKVYAEVLLRQFAQKNDVKTTDYLTRIIKQIDKLTLLIQDLLNVSRIQTNQLTFRIEQFDLNNIIKEIVGNMQPVANNHRLIIEGKAVRKVWGDQERISQVLLNLLTNALKYSPNANKVIIKVTNSKTEAIVSVQDFGIGIDKEHSEKIFNRFYRINDVNEQTFPGLGIGLYISQAIIKRHGGKISISSTKGKGSIFQFALPYHKKRIALEKE